MKTLVTTVFEYPHAGGLSSHVASLKSGLENLGHQADVLSISQVPDPLYLGLIRGPSFLLNKISPGTGMIWSHQQRFRLLKTLIRKRLHDGGYQVINAQDAFAGLAAKAAGAPLGIPVVLTLHGYLTFEAVSRGSLKRESCGGDYFFRTEMAAYRGVDRIVTVDTRIRNYVVEKVGRSRDIDTIPNFLDISSFLNNVPDRDSFRRRHDLDPQDIVLFCPRRLTEKNGVIIPALALPWLLERDRRFFLLYAGDGEQRERLEQVIGEQGLEKRVRLLGAVDQQTMRDYYALSDVVLIPSVHSAGVEEATSIAALEGMAAGLPVVASNIGGLAEIIRHRETGWLVPERDPSALAEAVLTLVRDQQLRENVGRQARDYIVTHHSHTSATRLYLEAYEKAIKSLRSTNSKFLSI
ncbi:MAG: glycosyltransferase family 4 protein [Bacillota bacterium]